MRVIKQISLDDWKCKVSCKECESELEIVYSDVIYYSAPLVNCEPGGEKFTVCCIVCRSTIYVSPDNIPTGIKSAIKRAKANTNYFNR